MKLRLPFRHHELFYYNKKLFIHYFLVPGRQVPFLVREGLGPQGPYRNYAYDPMPQHSCIGVKFLWDLEEKGVSHKNNL